MPELRAAGRSCRVELGSNLLDALLGAGVEIPYSCRAGSCHACLVRCLHGELLDAKPQALAEAQRDQGWRLACQCQVIEDVEIEAFDPARDGLPADVLSVDWPGATVLRLRLGTQKPLHYRAGQHLLLWSANGVARPYSLASLPGEDAWLEFHIDCRLPGAFSDAARQLQPGDRLRLGELRGGALHYDGDWQTRPLWLLAAGTGLAPLWALLREALRQQHQGEIRVLHVAREHYLAESLRELAHHHPQLRVDLIGPDELGAYLTGLKLASRQAVGLLCGSAASVETFARRLYLAGMPRNQVHADVFLLRVE